MPIKNIIVTVLCGLILIIILITSYNKNNNQSPLLLKNTSIGHIKHHFSSNRLQLAPINGGLEYTFSFWLYISNWSYKYGLDKHLVYWKGTPSNRGINKYNSAGKQCRELDDGDNNNGNDNGNDNNNGMVINEPCKSCQAPDLLEEFYSISKETHNTHKKKQVLPNSISGLLISLGKKSNTLIIRNTLIDDTESVLEINNIPIQKWLNITVILQLRNLDIFINGKLHESTLLSTLPIYQTGNLTINPNGGFDGYISRFQYINRAMKLVEIKREYNKGHPVLNNIEVSDNPIKDVGDNMNDNKSDFTYNKRVTYPHLSNSTELTNTNISLGQLCHKDPDCKKGQLCLRGKCGFKHQSRDYGETCWDNSSCKMGLACNNYGSSKLNKKQINELNLLGIPVTTNHYFNSELNNKPFRCLDNQ